MNAALRDALAGGLAATLVLASSLAAQDGGAVATMVDTEGNRAGSIRLTETPDAVLLQIRLSGLPPGAHGLHIHETGSCSPTFSAAGGHYAPRGHAHGFLHRDGPHAGDLANLMVPPSGRVVEERRVTAVTLGSATGSANDRATLFDEDGSAFILHQGPDDYASQPAGNAGRRILCGEIRRLGGQEGSPGPAGGAEPVSRTGAAPASGTRR